MGRRRCTIAVQPSYYKKKVTRCEKIARDAEGFCIVHKKMLSVGKRLSLWEGR